MTTAKSLKSALLAATLACAFSSHVLAGTVLLVSGVDGSSNVVALDASSGASMGTFTSNGGSALATAANGDVLHDEGSAIAMYGPGGQPLGNFATLSGYGVDVTVGPDGSVYALDGSSAYELDKYSSVGTFEGTVLAGNPYYQDAVIAPNGNIIVDATYAIDTFNSAGILLGSESTGAVSFGLTTGPDGNVYFSTASSLYGNGANSGEIYKCTGCETGTGTVSLFAADPNAGDLHGLLFDSSGSLFVASRFSNTVLQFDGTTGAYDKVFATLPSAFGPFDLTEAVSSTPEPASFPLMCAGVALIAAAASRRTRVGARGLA